MFTDGWFLQGADQAVSLHATGSAAPVFYYYFTYRGSISYSTIFGEAAINYGEKAKKCLNFSPTVIQNRGVLKCMDVNWIMVFIFNANLRAACHCYSVSRRVSHSGHLLNRLTAYEGHHEHFHDTSESRPLKSAARDNLKRKLRGIKTLIQ